MGGGGEAAGEGAGDSFYCYTVHTYKYIYIYTVNIYTYTSIYKYIYRYIYLQYINRIKNSEIYVNQQILLFVLVKNTIQIIHFHPMRLKQNVNTLSSVEVVESCSCS